MSKAADAARKALASLIDENERHRKEAGELRFAGLVLISYLRTLAKGKLAGPIQAREIDKAVAKIRQRTINEKNSLS